MIKAVILIIVYLALYYLVGFAVVKCSRGDEKQDSVMLNGMFAYAVIFFLLGFPMKLSQFPLTRIGAIWLGLLAVIVIFILWKWHGSIREDWKRKFRDVRAHKWISLGVAAVVILELVWVEMQNVPGSPLDAAYYIGEVSTSVFDNASGVSDVYSGEGLGAFKAMYAMETYLLHSSVICKVFHVAPLIEMRTVMSAVVIVMFNVIMWHMGRRLFRNDRRKMLLFLAGIFVFCMFYSSYYMPGWFLLSRTFEGKNILNNIFIPAVFLYFLRLLEEEKRSIWVGLFLTIWASFTYSMSATFIAPVYLLGIFAALILYKKKWGTVWRSAVCMIPAGAVVMFYFCVTRGYIRLSI